MATTATRNSNTVYLEASGGASTIDAVTAKGVQVYHVMVTSGAAVETLTLRDVTTTAIKGVFKAPIGTTELFSFLDAPLFFPNGIRVTLTQTDSSATLVVAESRG